MAKAEGWDGFADGDAEKAALKSELEKLRRKLRVSGAQTALILEGVREVLTENPIKLRIPDPPKQSGKKKDVEAVVCHLTDTQIGKITKTYDSAIAAERIKEYGRKVRTCIERHRSYAKIEELHLYLGGDLIEGETIFDGQAHCIDSSVLEQAVRTAPSIIAELIAGFLATVERVHVVGVPGNHGRSARKGSGAHPSTNWDRVAMETARLIVGSPRLTWNLPDDWWAVNEVLGHTHLLIHGDNLGSTIFGSAPFERRLLKWREAIPADWQTLFFGHFHRYTSGSISGITWHCGGTPESDNDYALRIVAELGRPMQRLQFWSGEYGLVADRPIYLTYGLEQKP